MCMHSRISKRNAYQLLLIQNSLSSMANICTDWDRKSEYDDGLASRNHSLPRDIACRQEECQQSYRKCEMGKADYYDNLVVSDDILMSKQLCQAYGVNVGSSENISVRLNSTKSDETSIGSLKKLPGKSYIIASSGNKAEKCEQNLKELTNRQKFLKLCNVKNQSDNSDRLSLISFAHDRIKPINYKNMQEISFRDLISTNVGGTSCLSEDSSPFHKHFGDGDKSSNSIYPRISTRWHTLACDRVTDTIEKGPLLLHSTVCDSSCSTSLTEYDPNLIANFDCRTRKTVIKFNGYVSTVMHYQPETKRLINEAFRLRFPHVHVSFSKIKSIKRELHQIAVACNLEDTTTAHAYVFYEKVLLKGLVCKMNRKLVAGAALLVAAKITDFGSVCVSDVVNHLESSLRINRKELLRYEIPLCAALSFDLRVPVWQLLPHYQRIALTIL
ncbi:Cyclin N-terminal domain family protein [Acanthocheilonema viteae]